MDTVAGVLRRRWWLLALPILLLGGAVLVFATARDGEYEAVATVRAIDRAAELRADAATRFSAPRFLDQVADGAGLAPGSDTAQALAQGLEVEQDGEHLVRIRYEAPAALEAQLVAGTAADLLLEARRADVAAAGREAEAAATARIDELEDAVAAARAELTRFDRQHPTSGAGAAPPSRAVQAEGDALTAEVERLQGSLQEARVALDEAERDAEAALAAARAEQMIARPLQPSDGSWPLWLLALPVLLAGLAIGIALAVTVERRDHTVRDEIDVQEATPGIPVLAVLDGP